ncbi:hypothetical protein [Aliiglaciecola litoralis]|uniref:Novel STAND NTPase 1 domain-containing protein n=1 Tax=Aliiglaciecola litoralis TaxID=582857 RepID=A0ABN1LJ46_9ALTE
MQPQHTETGNPFVGLNAFTEQQGTFFKGRDEFITHALQRLSKKAQEHQPFLLLLGNHGAGKSSLLRAGILANLNHSPLFPDIQQFHAVHLHPCDIGNDPIRALVLGLTQLQDYSLIDEPSVETMLKLGKEQPSAFIEKIKQAKATLPRDQNAVITVRQLERLFLNESLGEQEKHVFADLLVGLSSQCGIFVLASLRSDFYHRLSDFPGLLWLKQHGGQLDVLPPDIAQIRQMIAPVPLRFEEGKDGQPALDEFIAQRTQSLPNSLPALQYLMQHLYDNQSQNGLVNYSTYRKLGGIDRVIAKITEQAYESLERPSKRTFNRLVNRLAAMNKNGNYERIWAKREELLSSSRAQQVIDTFTKIGVFSQYTDNNQQVYISLSHDCLFEYWPRLLETLDSHQKLQLLKQTLEVQASEWKSSTRPSTFLLPSGKALDEGKLILKQGGMLSKQLRSLIHASIKRARLQRRLWLSGLVVLLLLFGFTLNNAYNAKLAKKQAEDDLIESHKLIEFLIDDESVKLEEIGRLDVMQAGAKRTFDYLSNAQDADDSTAAKQSRSQTFFQIGQVFLQSKKYNDAIEAFEKAREFNDELVGIHPNGFDYHLALAQINYWIGMTHMRAQDVGTAEQYFLFYQKNAFDLVELQPDNAVAKMELSRAYYHLANIASERGQMESAAQSYFEAVKFAEKGKSAASQKALENSASAYNWLANKYKSDLKITEALEMIKGEERVRARLLKSYGGEDYRLQAALTQWSLAQTHILLGQRKQAQNVLTDLTVKSGAMIDKFGAEIQWRYLNSFSLAGLAYVAIQSANLDSASEFMQQSYAILNDVQTSTDPLWAEAIYERQYWYARMFQQQQKSFAFNTALARLNKTTDTIADKWKKRAANLQQISVDIDLGEADMISHPQALIADLEYASIHNDLQRLTMLWQIVPQEMWKNTDLENMRPKLRQQIQELKEQQS